MILNRHTRALLKEIEDEFGGQVQFEVKEDHWYWRAIALLLKVISFGKIDFMNDFVTTLGPKIGLPRPIEEMGDSAMQHILVHERIHLRQIAKFSSNLWVGLVPFALLYLLVPFPLFFSYFRYKYEKEGYEASIRAQAELYGVQFVKTEKYKKSIIRHFTGPDYGFMWVHRKSVEKWFDEVVNSL